MGLKEDPVGFLFKSAVSKPLSARLTVLMSGQDKYSKCSKYSSEIIFTSTRGCPLCITAETIGSSRNGRSPRFVYIFWIRCGARTNGFRHCYQLGRAWLLKRRCGQGFTAEPIIWVSLDVCVTATVDAKFSLFEFRHVRCDPRG